MHYTPVHYHPFTTFSWQSNHNVFFVLDPLFVNIILLNLSFGLQRHLLKALIVSKTTVSKHLENIPPVYTCKTVDTLCDYKHAYQAEQQTLAGVESWGQAAGRPQTAGTGEWSGSCHSRRAWEHVNWSRLEHCIERTLSPARSGHENRSPCTGTAPPDGGPPKSEPPGNREGGRM